jgi:hypothetical protein
MTARKRRWAQYDVRGVGDTDAHALEVSGWVRELQAHLDRVRRGEASAEETAEVTRMVRAARRASAARRDRGHLCESAS